jgi:hypothetical protein
VNKDLEKIRKEVVIASSRYYPCSPDDIKRKPRKASFRAADASADIQTEDLMIAIPARSINLRLISFDTNRRANLLTPDILYLWLH